MPIYKVWLGHYSHKHGRDVALYPTRLACKLGLFSAVLPYMGSEDGPLSKEDALKFVRLYAAGDYDKAILFFNDKSETESLWIEEGDFDPAQQMRPYNAAELAEIVERINARDADEKGN